MVDAMYEPTQELLAEVEPIEAVDVDDLYVDLGKALTMQEQPSLMRQQTSFSLSAVQSYSLDAAAYSPQLLPNDWGSVFGNIRDFFFSTGKTFFKKVEKEFLAALCGDDENYTDVRERIKGWMDSGTVVLTAALIPVLAGTMFGYGAVVAPILANLLVKVTLKAGYDTACEVWTGNN